MGAGTGRLLAAGIGAHAAGVTMGNAALAPYVARVHAQVQADIATLSANRPLQPEPLPAAPGLQQQPSVWGCCLRAFLIVGFIAWLASTAGFYLLAAGSGEVLSVLAGSALLSAVPATIAAVVVGIPVGLGTYTSRARAYSRCEGARVVQRYYLERERLRRAMADGSLDPITAASILSRQPNGVEMFRVIG